VKALSGAVNNFQPRAFLDSQIDEQRLVDQFSKALQKQSIKKTIKPKPVLKVITHKTLFAPSSFNQLRYIKS
jgi:hypothetical protein